MKNGSSFKMIAVIAVLTVLSVQHVYSKSTQFSVDDKEQFDSYWYRNSAELTHYRLEQARYGEIHKGSAVLVFVTEPMNGKLQVKADPPYDGKDIIPVLKLNLTKKFNTGIYPYSLMTSVFSPVDTEGVQFPEKITMSVQEWCGHVFTQMNLKWNGYRTRSFSYFEGEHDQAYTLKKAIPEDGIWNMIRLGPDTLPIGELNMLPSLEYTRFNHIDPKPVRVVAVLTDSENQEGMQVYTLRFPELNRTLSITFEKEFPYHIEEWEETYPNGRGDSPPMLTTRAVLVKRIMTDYWMKHSNADLPLREELGLSVE